MAIAWKQWNQSDAMKRCLLTLTTLAFWAIATPAYATADDVIVYEVKRGDTLFSIGDKYFVRGADYAAVQKTNGIRNDRTIPVGTKIKISRRFLKFQSSVAQLISVRGNVSLTDRGTQNVATKGGSLGEGAILRTAASSFVTILLENGSRVSLPSNSDLKILRLRRYLIDSSLDYDFEVGRGAARSKVTPLKSANDRYVVKTPKAVSAVRGTEFQSRYDAASGTDFSEVTEGAVAVDMPSNASTLVAAGNGLSVNADGAVVHESLLAAADIPAAGRLQKEKIVSFTLPKQAENSAMLVSLAADAGFVDELADTRVNGETAQFENVEDGNYFARFRAVSPSGIEGIPVTYAFKRRLNSVSASGGKGDFGYSFKWSGQGRGTLRYHFQLFQGKTDGIAMVDEAGLNMQEISISDLPAGDYFWRVASIQYVDGEISTSWTPFEKLSVTAS